MAYTDIDDPSKYMQTALFTGNGGTNAITNTGNSDLQPDWIWFKRRNGTDNHILFDVVRGVTKGIYADLNNAQDNLADSLSSFNSDGFTLGADTGSGGSINGSSETMVAWQWKAGTSFTNDASGTGIGTIDSAGSFNNDAGFSIVTYSGTGSNGTIKHGLNSVPKIILWKRIDNNAGAVNWIVQSTLFGNQTKLVLNTTEAFSTNSSFSQTNNWTSSLIDLKNYEGQNASNGTYIAYCFAEKKGYSKFGSYKGNGNANGTFIYTGFKPALFICKRTDATSDWFIWDNKRGAINEITARLVPNENGAEGSASIDFVSNGIKIRNNATARNASGGTYIYMAFAENPFVTSSGVPATAR